MALKNELSLFNSITRKKEPFIPKEEKVTWYSCGPTVYDHAHMGHARSYISFDILRRVLKDYFKYEIYFVQNVTDIDDKIIKRARTKHLMEEYLKATKSMPVHAVTRDLQLALDIHITRLKTAETADPDKHKMFLDQMNKCLQASVNLKQCVDSNENEEKQRSLLDLMLDASEPIIGEWLDRTKGHTVTNNDIFIELPRYFEDSYNKDMKSLNVLPPDVVTRVSEFVPQIIAFVEKIISNGYAYESNGSVYFDVAKFDAQPQHRYAKLVPEAYGSDTRALEEAEGALSSGVGEKRSPNDFALWKNSKPGEPSWKSPWGLGRPGWHIECSAMAGETLGDSMDIHSGGVDLKFPHHDNELAQSEAHYGCSDWVRYFLHTGHLHIDGCKMSKSLKNFVSIGDALERYSSNQLRIAFLLHHWKDTLDYSSNTMEGAEQYLRMVSEFCLTASDIVRKGGEDAGADADHDQLATELTKAKSSIHEALCDSVDTKTALEHMRKLVSASNVYCNNCKPRASLVQEIQDYVKHILSVFGVVMEDYKLDTDAVMGVLGDIFSQMKLWGEESVDPSVCQKFNQICSDIKDSKLPAIGLSLKELSEGKPSLQIDCQDKLQDASQVASVIAVVREDVREWAKTFSDKKVAVPYLQYCDHIRDAILPPIGVRLEDKDGQASTIKVEDPAILMKEVENKKKAEQAKKEEKERKKQQQQASETTMQAPEEMFRTEAYSQWNDAGVPTHTADGEPVNKSQTKKLTKQMEAYRKKYEKWLSKQ